MKTKGKRLLVRDFKALLETMRHWPVNYRTQVAPLVLHVYALQGEIDALSHEVNLLKQKTIWEDIETNRKPVEAQERYQDRGERLWELLHSGIEKVNMYLKFNPEKNIDELINEANIWARQNNRFTLTTDTIYEVNKEKQHKD